MLKIMNKLSKNQKGFTAVEGLLIILILVVIGGVGYMIYHNNHKSKVVSAVTSTTTNKTASSTSTVSKIPNFPAVYNGWSNYCISSVGLCLKYPQGYNLENCADGPSPSDCGIETKDVRNGSDSFPVVSWSISAASDTQSSTCDQSGVYSVESKIPYISDTYIAKFTVTNDPGFTGEATYYLLQGNGTGQPNTTHCPTAFSSKDGKYTISISARDGSPAAPTLSNAQIDVYDQTIAQILNSFYYQ